LKARTRILAGLLEAAALLVAVYFEPTYCMRGHLHGEAFFDGKPTSWWRRELENWEVEAGDNWHWRWRYLYTRQPTRFEKILECFKTDAQKQNDLMVLVFQCTDGGGPSPALLNGHAEAQPVLRALLDDPSPKIRRFGRIGLNMDEE
jgi:hypothetical protein